MFFIQQNILLVRGDEANKLLEFLTLNSSNIKLIPNKYRNKTQRLVHLWPKETVEESLK